MMYQGTVGNIDHGKTPLAAAIAKHLAERRLAKYVPFDPAGKAPGEKERGAMITFWQCFYLNNILIKCMHTEEKEEVVHGK